jgi:hypothetical protein
VTDRIVAVLAGPAPDLLAGLVTAMLEDVVDLVTDTPQVTPALAVPAGHDVAAQALTWPGTPVVSVPAQPTVGQVLAAAARADAPAVAVVAPDVPDLPTLLLGKLFSALAGPSGAAAAVCAAVDGGLVAVSANLPLAGWVVDLQVRLDDRDALAVLQQAAPPGGLRLGPGWHRVRAAADLATLDPGLEGWEATRAYLASH